MKAIVISDVHIGSKFFLRELFAKFIGNLPPDVALILNGDTVDKWHKTLTGEHAAALDLIRAESLKRRVVWIYGNHDDGLKLADPGRIEFRGEYSIGKRLYLAHGYDFDNVMPHNKMFIRLFRAMHHCRIWLGADAIHVAHYAKRWSFFYHILCKNVTRNAIQHARENGYEAVVCGHTHYIEDRMVDGIRYLNTGSWTEPPVCCLSIDDHGMKLHRIDPINLVEK